MHTRTRTADGRRRGSSKDTGATLTPSRKKIRSSLMAYQYIGMLTIDVEVQQGSLEGEWETQQSVQILHFPEDTGRKNERATRRYWSSKGTIQPKTQFTRFISSCFITVGLNCECRRFGFFQAAFLLPLERPTYQRKKQQLHFRKRKQTSLKGFQLFGCEFSNIRMQSYNTKV